MNGRHNDRRDRSNKRHGNRGTEDIMTKGTEYVKDKVTDEHIRGGNRGIGSWSVGKGTMGGQMDK